MTWKAHHTQSQSYASQAEFAFRQGQLDQAVKYYELAAEAELQAINELDISKTRTLGITVVSACALYYKARKTSLAQQLAYSWLSKGQLPLFAIEQLEAILRKIWDERDYSRAGLQFNGTEIFVAIKGGQIVTGGAPLDLIVQKVEEIQALFYRTAEFLMNLPFRKHGNPPEKILQEIRPWLFQAVPSSYQFAIRIEQTKQLSLFPEFDIPNSDIAPKLLQIIQASVSETRATLEEMVPDTDYRKTFLKMARNLAPSGEGAGKIELTTASSDLNTSLVLIPESRQIINRELRKLTPPPSKPIYEQAQIKGVLRGLSLEEDWLDIISIDEESSKRTIRVKGVGEMVDDVIGPMVNRRVVVDAYIRNGKHHFIDIQPLN